MFNNIKLAQKPDAGDIGQHTETVAEGAQVPTEQGIPQLAGMAIDVVFSVVGTIFLVLMVYGGIVWMSSRGNAEQIEKAKNTVTRAAIGLAIILASYAFVNFIMGRF